ncbi:MAG: DUF2274 domain-containing protein [Agitococcus sp.]|nr:DUF2274 domain-containing protein [Agitococcus sp.]
MKLKRIEKADPVQRITTSIRGSTLDMLSKYQMYYKKTYGEDIDRSQLTNDILKEYMNEDKAFLKALPNLELPPASEPKAGESDDAKL